MQYPERLLHSQVGARLLEKFDPAFGPLKENGTSLLNGAMSEFHRRVQNASEGQRRPPSLYENSNK